MEQLERHGISRDILDADADFLKDFIRNSQKGRRHNTTSPDGAVTPISSSLIEPASSQLRMTSLDDFEVMKKASSSPRLAQDLHEARSGAADVPGGNLGRAENQSLRRSTQKPAGHSTGDTRHPSGQINVSSRRSSDGNKQPQTAVNDVSRQIRCYKKELDPALAGGFGVIRLGVLNDGTDAGKRVAIKTLRLHFLGVRDVKYTKVTFEIRCQ